MDLFSFLLICVGYMAGVVVEHMRVRRRLGARWVHLLEKKR